MIRGNQAPFMTKDLSKQIMIRSRLRNKFNKHKTRLHWENYARQRNVCTSLRRKTIKQHFSKHCENGVIKEAKFWSSIKPFMSNKGCHNNSNLNLLENGVFIRDELKIANTFNDFYVNTVQNISGKSIGNISLIDSPKPHDSDNEIDSIIEKYKEHPSTELIKANLPEPHTFAFEKASKDGISKIIKGLNSTTATGIDTIRST